MLRSFIASGNFSDVRSFSVVLFLLTQMIFETFASHCARSFMSRSGARSVLQIVPEVSTFVLTTRGEVNHSQIGTPYVARIQDLYHRRVDFQSFDFHGNG